MENKRIPDYCEMPFFPNDPWGGQKGDDAVLRRQSKPGALVLVSHDEEGNLILKIIEDAKIVEQFKSLLKKIEVERLDEDCAIDPQKFESDPHPIMPFGHECGE